MKSQIQDKKKGGIISQVIPREVVLVFITRSL